MEKKFDYAAARNAGASDQQIQDYLTQQRSQGINISIDKANYDSYVNKQAGVPTAPDTVKAPTSTFGGALVSGAIGAAKGALGFVSNVGLGALSDIYSNIESGIQGGLRLGEAVGLPKDVAEPLISGAEKIKKETQDPRASSTIGGMVGTGLTEAGILAAPTGPIGKGKALVEGSKLGKMALSAAEKVPAISSGVSWLTQKVLRAIPEATFGYGYGTLKGESPTEAAKTAAGFGGISGGGEIVGKALSEKGPVADMVEKAFGITGTKGAKQTLQKTDKAVSALQTMVKMAHEDGGVIIKDINGIERRWDPTKDGAFEALGAWIKVKNDIYHAYTELANKAGDKGAAFTSKDFAELKGTLRQFHEAGSMSAHTNAAKMMEDAVNRYGTKLPGKSGIFFPDTSFEKVQKLLESANQTVDPANPAGASAKVADAFTRKLRDIMDTKISSATGGQYQGLRNAYANLKTIENDLSNVLKSGANKPGGKVFNRYIEGYGAIEIVQSVVQGNLIGAARGGALYLLGKGMERFQSKELQLTAALKKISEDLSPKAPGPIKTRILGGESSPIPKYGNKH